MQLSSTQKIIAIALVAFLFLFFATGRKSDKNRPSQTYSQEAYDTVHGTHVLTDGCADAKKTKLNLLEEAIDAVFDGEFRQAGKKLAYLNIFSAVDCKTTNVPIISPSKDEPFADAPPQPSVPPKTSQNNDFAQSLDSFPLATSTWGDTLNPSKNYPASGFTSYYFNTDNPAQVIYQQNTPAIQAKYILNENMKIPADKFGGYWVGKIQTEKPQYYSLVVNKNWSKVRVIIDRHIVIEQERNRENSKVYLPKGEHIIEVEYASFMHTVEMWVQIQPLIIEGQPHDTKAFVQDIIKKYPNVVGYYASVYQPSNNSYQIAVNIKNESNPVILFLSSNSAVSWVIPPTKDSNIVAVVYGVGSEGGDVQGLSTNKFARINNPLGDYQVESNCQCDKKKYDCEKTADTLYHDIENLSKTYNISIVGFAGKQSVKEFSFVEHSLALNESKNLVAIKKEVFTKLDLQCRSQI